MRWLRSGVLPPDRTVKYKTVQFGGNYVTQRKIPVEEMIRIVELYLSEKIGYSSVYLEAVVSEETFRKWLFRYKTDGPSGFLPKEHNKRYTKETKLSTVLDYLAGKGSKWEICERYGIRDKRQLEHWLKVYNRHKDFRIQTGDHQAIQERIPSGIPKLDVMLGGEGYYRGSSILISGTRYDN